MWIAKKSCVVELQVLDCQSQMIQLTARLLSATKTLIFCNVSVLIFRYLVNWLLLDKLLYFKMGPPPSVL